MLIITAYATHAAELCANDGPTGEFVEVLAGEIRDAGGNILFAGTADECIAYQEQFIDNNYRMRCPTSVKKSKVEISGSDFLWGYAVE